MSFHTSTTGRDTHASHKKKELNRKTIQNRAHFIKLVIPLLLLECNSFLMLVRKLGLLSPHLLRTAFNYFAYYCVLLLDKNKAELITHPEMRNLNH